MRDFDQEDLTIAIITITIDVTNTMITIVTEGGETITIDGVETSRYSA
jgi:hypothetical protein